MSVGGDNIHISSCSSTASNELIVVLIATKYSKLIYCVRAKYSRPKQISFSSYKGVVVECKSQDSAGDFCIILWVAKQAGVEKKRAVFCCLSAISAPEAASLRLPAHPRNCTDFALRALGFTF